MLQSGEFALLILSIFSLLSHSTPCKKADFKPLQIVSRTWLGFFLPVSDRICHSPFKKVKRQPTLTILFSQNSQFFEGHSKHSSRNPTGVIRYLGELAGESVTK